MRYRFMRPGEAGPVVRLVSAVFDEFVAPGYVEEGIDEFKTYICADRLEARLADGNIALLAEAGNRLVGVIEIRDNSHIALLFVAALHQRKGIGRELVRRAIDICRRRDPRLPQITVNASPNACTAYMAMGFACLAGEKTVNGLRFIPMALALPGH